MVYKFIILPDAEKQLRSLEVAITKRILKKIKWFSKQEHPLRFATPLHHAEIGDVRFRIGDYRVIAVLDEKKKVFAIAAVGHRREIYR